MITREEARVRATHVEWDDDAIRSVFRSKCSCGGVYYMINYYRSPYRPTETDCTRCDVIECVCGSCRREVYCSFVPVKIHAHLRDLIGQNV